MRTLLFDIDGTLLTAHGGGKAAMRLALRDEFGVDDPDVEMRFDGRTDCGLLVDLLNLNGVEASPSAQVRFREAYVGHFPTQLAETGGLVFAGVRNLLGRLSGCDGCHVAVMTGNLAETASRKLKHFDLHQNVQWIIGGDLDVHRNDLARRARDEIRQRHGSEASEQVVVIGDTVADIECGRAIDADVVAVCTGGTDRETLQAASPDVIWDDFSDWESVADSLQG